MHGLFPVRGKKFLLGGTKKFGIKLTLLFDFRYWSDTFSHMYV